jgi:hypothetical protein
MEMSEETVRQQRAKCFKGSVVALASPGGTRHVTIASVERAEIFAGYGRTRRVPIRFTTTEGQTFYVREILL